jgi:hypothetical protein
MGLKEVRSKEYINTFAFARHTTAKASLTSKRSISFTVTPARLRAKGTANEGAMGKSSGAYDKPLSRFSLAKALNSGHIEKSSGNIGALSKLKELSYSFSVGVTSNDGKRLQTLLFRGLRCHQHHCRGTIANRYTHARQPHR